MTEKTLYHRLDDIERDLDGDDWLTGKYMRRAVPNGVLRRDTYVVSNAAYEG